MCAASQVSSSRSAAAAGVELVAALLRRFEAAGVRLRPEPRPNNAPSHPPINSLLHTACRHTDCILY
jgi:hypothetical protein